MTAPPVPYEDHRAQLEALLAGWGMPADGAGRTAEVMAWADLHGIDSHGISMVPAYYKRHLDGQIRMAARPSIVRETPVSALLDGNQGLGHEPSRQAMELAIAKAKAVGIGVAPSGSSTPRLGTDPRAFAAPGRDGEPFMLDMATTTVAAGRVRNKANENLPAPPGWLITRDGAPSTDPREASDKGGSLTSLGGSLEGGS